MLYNEIKALIPIELREAEKKHGARFTTPEESMGVIFEEVVLETSPATYEVEAKAFNFFEAIHENRTGFSEAVELEQAAIHLAAEAVQVAAMAHKHILSL